MNAPLQNGLQAAVAKVHKPKVFWTEKEQALIAGEVARMLSGADPVHTNLGPYIKAAQHTLLPTERRRHVNSLLIRQVRDALLLKAPAPEPVAETLYVLWREVTAHELIDVLEANPNALWRRGDSSGRMKVVSRRFASAQGVADYCVELGWVEEITP